MKTVILSLILSHVGFASGQTILLSEHKIPDWNNGQMTLYFDLAIHPEIMPDGSFQFAETMPEDIEFWIEHDKRWVAEDMFPYCFDDALDQLEISKPNVSFWYFQTARLNARTDGTHDGTVQLQQSSGKALGFMYADGAVAIIKGAVKPVQMSL